MSEITARDVKYLRRAARVADTSDCSDKHGTIVVRGSNIIAIATNRIATHPVSKQWLKGTIHSEQRAISRLGEQAKGGTLYTARSHDNPISKPCEMCETLIHEAGITKVIYNDGKRLKSFVPKAKKPALKDNAPASLAL
jgi:deoxycytidylate deaminase